MASPVAGAQPLAGAARDHVPAAVAGVAQVAEARRGRPVVALAEEPAAAQVAARRAASSADDPSDNRRVLHSVTFIRDTGTCYKAHFLETSQFSEKNKRQTSLAISSFGTRNC